MRSRTISFAVLGVGALAALLFLMREQPAPAPFTASLPEIPEFSAPEAEIPSFVEVTEGCDPDFAGGCVNVRVSATSTAPAIHQLRTGVVLPVASSTVTDSTGRTWYRILFTEWIRYPDRVPKDWYVAEDYVRAFYDPGATELQTGHPATKKRIVVDRSDQMLFAYDGDELFLQTPISTGLDLSPTPRGTFTVFRKTPSRYMQGPLPGISDQYYDLPGVPWNLYFTKEGGAIHGAYWHDGFGAQRSHGCVNLPVDVAQTLYEWAPLGTAVLVQD